MKRITSEDQLRVLMYLVWRGDFTDACNAVKNDVDVCQDTEIPEAIDDKKKIRNFRDLYQVVRSAGRFAEFYEFVIAQARAFGVAKPHEDDYLETLFDPGNGWTDLKRVRKLAKKLKKK